MSSNTFRHPAILLKEAVTVDHISGGRLILGIGTGWHEDEHRRYGIDLPPAPERVDRFEEAVEVISLLMAQERTTFQGRYYQLDDARLEPRPLQQPRIPILIAAHRPRMLRIAARYADQWDTFGVDPGRRDGGRRDRRSPIASRPSMTPAGRSVATRPTSDGRPGRRAMRCARRMPISTSSAATTGLASPTSRPCGPSTPISPSSGAWPARSSPSCGLGGCSSSADWWQGWRDGDAPRWPGVVYEGQAWNVDDHGVVTPDGRSEAVGADPRR